MASIPTATRRLAPAHLSAPQRLRPDSSSPCPQESAVETVLAVGSGPIPRAALPKVPPMPQALALAFCEVRALPPATPALAQRMAQVIVELAAAGYATETATLACEMTERFPLRPELTHTVLRVAATVDCKLALTSILGALGRALLRTYAHGGDSLFEWTQRLAYQLRRGGHGEAATCMQQCWQPLFLT